MLNSSNAIQEDTCQAPDPEERLQSARKQKEMETEALDAFKEFIRKVNYLERDNELATKSILGELTMKVMQAEANEQRWLDKIDKD